MSRRLPSRTLLAGALALVLVLAGVLIAALGGGSSGGSGKPGTTRQQREIAVAARYVGLSEQQVKRELAAGSSLAQIAAARHKPLGGLVDQLTAVRTATHGNGAGVSAPLRNVIRRTVERSVARSGFVGPPAIGASGPVAAAYLGMTTAQVRAELRSGRTLAQIADATPGRSSHGLLNALVRARRNAVLRARANGAISASAAQRLLGSLRERLAIAVHRRLVH